MEAEQQVLGRLADLDRAIASLTSQVEILQEEFDRQAKGVKAQLERTDDHLAGVADQQQQVNLALGLIQRLPDEQPVTVPRQFEAVQQQVQGLETILGQLKEDNTKWRREVVGIAEQLQALRQAVVEVAEQTRVVGQQAIRAEGTTMAVLAEMARDITAVKGKLDPARGSYSYPYRERSLEDLRARSGDYEQLLKLQGKLIRDLKQMPLVLQPPTWTWHSLWIWISQPVPFVSVMLVVFFLILNLSLPGMVRVQTNDVRQELGAGLVMVNDNVNTALLRLARVEEVIGSNPGDG